MEVGGRVGLERGRDLVGARQHGTGHVGGSPIPCGGRGRRGWFANQPDFCTLEGGVVKLIMAHEGAQQREAQAVLQRRSLTPCPVLGTQAGRLKTRKLATLLTQALAHAAHPLPDSISATMLV